MRHVTNSNGSEFRVNSCATNVFTMLRKVYNTVTKIWKPARKIMYILVP